MKDKILDELYQILTDVYICRRVWSAWSYGTMTEDDFDLAGEDENIMEDIYNTVMTIIKQNTITITCPDCEGTGDIYQEYPDCLSCGECFDNSVKTVPVCEIPTKCPTCNGSGTVKAVIVED